jgi:hypothetical protein
LSAPPDDAPRKSVIATSATNAAIGNPNFSAGDIDSDAERVVTESIGRPQL